MKHIIYIALLAVVATACGNNGDSPAQQLYAEADQAYQTKNFALATSLIDSLQKAYPQDIEVQRQALALRPHIIEGLTEQQITTADSLLAFNEAESQRLKADLKWVKTPRMIEGYWTPQKGYNANFMNGTGLQPRVSEIGEFYVVSSLNPAGNVKHTSVTLSSGGESVSTPAVPFDGESNYRIDGGEIITFSPAQSDTLGVFAAAHDGQPLTLEFRGKGVKKMKMTPTQTSAMALAYRYAAAIKTARRAQVDRQRLDRTLEIARQQIARTAPEN